MEITVYKYSITRHRPWTQAAKKSAPLSQVMRFLQKLVRMNTSKQQTVTLTCCHRRSLEPLMPVRYVYEERGICKQFHGFVSGDDFAESTATTASRPEFDTADYVIVDFTAVSGNSIDLDSLEAAPIQQSLANKWSRRAVRVAVVAPDEATLSLMRTFVSSRQEQGYETKIFGTLPEARTWLATG